jgi:protocatechuate 3,4-dioxygenase beta subunit
VPAISWSFSPAFNVKSHRAASTISRPRCRQLNGKLFIATQLAARTSPIEFSVATPEQFVLNRETKYTYRPHRTSRDAPRRRDLVSNQVDPQEGAMSPLTLLALTFTITQQAAVPQQAAVSGTVLEAGTNTPVAGAQVTLMSFALRPQPGRPPEPLVATTDQNGQYRFEALESGRYRVSVQKAGFATMFGPGLPEATLKAGERKTDLNVTIQRGAAIVGRVLDENGEPIANAHVMAWRRPPVPNGAAAAGRLGLIPAGSAAQTNDLGEFRLFGLAPGEVYVQATSGPDFGRSASPRPTVPLATYFPGIADVVGAMPITLAAGQTSGEITIRMVSAPAFQISGVITDEGGRPVENALVRLLLERTPGEPPMPFMGRMQSARSDKAGNFTISGVVNGSYTLLAIAPVLLSTRDAGRGGAAGAGMSTSFTSGTVTGGVVSGFIGGGVTTETVKGVTTQYRDDAGTRVAVTVHDASVAGVEVVVVRAAAR